MRRLIASLAAVLAPVLLVWQGSTAAAAGDTPVQVSSAQLKQSLVCSGLGSAHRQPVLLIPGTLLDGPTNFDWNYARVLRERGRSYCMVTLPGRAMGDIQVAAEYVVHALRRMHTVTGKRVQVVGYSQGGMITRWVLKYWPSTRKLVDDVIGIDPSNHGTLDSVVVCTIGCAPAFWQQRTGSAFLTALNTGPETWPGISYTQVYSLTDEVVIPNFGTAASSRLSTGRGRITNIAVQSICPAHVAEHLTMGTIDPVAYAVVMDALTHDGPAQARRISRSVCTQLLMPGVDQARLLPNMLRVTIGAANGLAYPHVAREPDLATYAR